MECLIHENEKISAGWLMVSYSTLETDLGFPTDL